ncbi:translation elongation factor Ts [Marinigracilibium pacificum]|uniref:Elongation factor Ts n=1 Tax=Marinigracilibium pacificum TaxID=2729599 RepID=A0A848J237_9BACT|nr:translation elongation factor Ts [Marinigracilibium pacificum]NMM49565.1 elongation factor Ts [Marinigracilibium pacificum]
MAVTAKEVNKLRQMTGAGMMDCKKALVEADGDFDKAVEILRKKGQKVSAKRSDRETNEGSVFVRTNDDKSKGIIIAIGCETDFVGKNEEFIKLGESITDAAFNNNPATIDELKQVKIGNETVEDKITELVGKIGEKIDILSYEIMEGEQVVPYVHAGNKLGVLVSLKNTDGSDLTDAGRDVAMQIAAMNPVALDKDGVDSATVEKEIEIGKEQARAEGKPEQIVEKIAMGKLAKFFKENTLLEQAFVKDNSQSISQYLNGVKNGLTVSEFKRISIG